MSLTAEDLNELCSSSYLEGLDDAPVAALRTKRDACQRAEMVLSYLRRVLQGEIDLVTAELDQRRETGGSDVRRLVEDLPSILSSPAAGGAPPPRSSVPIMGDVGELGDDIAPEDLLDELAAELGPKGGSRAVLLGANVCALPEEELSESLSRLKELEQQVSRKRRQLHEHIDSIQEAIVDRYKSGAANPDSLLA
jgi:hypothetical protein